MTNHDEPSRTNARAHFAAFFPELQAAMKAAGKVEAWSSLQWQTETLLVAELIEANHYAQPFIDTLVSVYQDVAGIPATEREAA